MNIDELRDEFRHSYQNASESELEEMVLNAAENPDAEWVRVALGGVMQPGAIGPSLDALAYNDEIHIIRQDEPSVRPILQETTRTALNVLLGFIFTHSRPLMALEAAAFACGFSIRHGDTIPAIAKKHGVSKQAFSKCVKDLASELGLPMELPGRSEKASIRMSLCNKRNEKLSRKAR